MCYSRFVWLCGLCVVVACYSRGPYTDQHLQTDDDNHTRIQVYESLTAHYAKVVAKNEKKKKRAAAKAGQSGGEGEDGEGVAPHSLRLQHEEEPVPDGGELEMDMSA